MFTYHAGESFDHPFQGLRRIDEILRYAPDVKRLGHGVALAGRKRRGEKTFVRRSSWTIWCGCGTK